jgi:uncharacterized protein
MKKITFLSITGLVLLFLLSLSFGFGSLNLQNLQKSSDNSSQKVSNSNSISNFSQNSNSNSISPKNLETNSSNSNISNLENSKISLTFDKLEIAKTAQEQQKGLMFRGSLCENCGMIFEFKDEDYRSFWMKNTWIDLDIIFIDSGGKIINIQNAKSEGNAAKTPKGYLDYQTYSSTDKAKYVLEINSGSASRMNLEAGKYLEIDKLVSQSVAFDNSFDQK